VQSELDRMAAVGGEFHSNIRAPLVRGLPCSTKWRNKTPDVHRTDRLNAWPKAYGIGERYPRAAMSVQRSAHCSTVSLANLSPSGAQLQFSCTPVSGDHGTLRGTEDMLLWDTGSRTSAQLRQTMVASIPVGCGHRTNVRAARRSLCRRAKKRTPSM
jgi:hypothetical protein